jgi:hypothetical protein
MDEPGRLRQQLPGGMVEVVAPHAADAVDAVAGIAGVVDARTFGDRLHVRLADEGAAAGEAFAGAIRSVLADAQVRTVEPSLEDVFIATLEEKERVHV